VSDSDKAFTPCSRKLHKDEAEKKHDEKINSERNAKRLQKVASPARRATRSYHSMMMTLFGARFTPRVGGPELRLPRLRERDRGIHWLTRNTTLIRGRKRDPGALST